MATHDPAARKSSRARNVVLVVDTDDRTIARLEHLLARFDCQSMEAATAHEALMKADQLTPSLIIASVDLPDMNIIEFIRRIRLNAGTAHIPVVGLLNGADSDLSETCIRRGAAGCVFRPVEAEALYRTVEKALEKNQRKTLRVRAILPVKVSGEQHDALYGAYTVALSSGGMFLHTMNPVAVNSEVSLAFDLNGRLITAGSVVIYNCQTGCGPDTETGIGLRFTDISKGDRSFISEFVKSEVMKGIASSGSR